MTRRTIREPLTRGTVRAGTYSELPRNGQLDHTNKVLVKISLSLYKTILRACGSRPPRIVKLFEKYTRTSHAARALEKLSHAARALEKLWHSEELGLGTALFFDPSDGFVTARYPPYPAVSPLSQLWSSKNTTTGGANLCI